MIINNKKFLYIKKAKEKKNKILIYFCKAKKTMNIIKG